MSPTRGILLMISAVTLFTAMAALIKAAPVPAGQAVFFRSFFALPVILVWLALSGHLGDGLRTSNWRGHAVRGIAGTCAMGLGFAGLRYLPLPEVTAIRFATPILIVVFAAFFLGERFRLIRMAAVLVGLVGVLIVIWPRLTFAAGDGARFGVAVTLASAALAALAQIFVKSMAARESTAAIVFYFSCTAAAASLFTVPFGWVRPTPSEAALLVSAGLVGGIGQILLTASYRHADAGVLAPFTYTSMLWAVLIGWVVFAEVPTVPMLAGSALIVLAGVGIVLRERQLGLRRTAERKLGGQG